MYKGGYNVKLDKGLYRIPEPGEIWEKDNLIRIIVKYEKYFEEEYNVVFWRRKLNTKIFKVWLPSWNEWEKDAKKLDIKIENLNEYYLLKFPKLPRRQDNLRKQMEDLIDITKRCGMNNAHNWLRKNISNF